MPRKNETDEPESTEEAMQSPPRPERKSELAAASLAGLVKMKKTFEGEDKFIHAHPTAVKNHKENGWKEV